MALMELQRKYKIMETNRRAYTEDAQVHIKRQRAIIDKLKEENDALKGELSAELDAPGAMPTPNDNAEIMRLTDFGDLYTRKIEMERRRVEELDQHLALSEAAIIQQKKAMGGGQRREGERPAAHQAGAGAGEQARQDPHELQRGHLAEQEATG